jgi:DNA invertase Pin-like site-specific DNA recombinase
MADKKYVIYLRVSTDKQGIKGNGIDAQYAACVDFIGAGTIVGEYREVESGNSNKRPELELALEQCHIEGAVLLVAKLDRLSRNLAFVTRLMEAGIKFQAVDNPVANDLSVHILVAFAQHEREQISARTKAALAVVKARGKTLGSKDIIKVAERGRQARTANALEYAESVYPTIERIRSFGITNLRDIAKELTDRKVETPSRQAKIDKDKAVFGAPKWHPQQVASIIKRVEAANA